MGDIVESIKQLYELSKKGLTVDARQEFLAIQEEAVNIKTENLELIRRVKDLEEKLEIKEKLHWDGSIYWLDEEKEDGPYCQRCWDVEQNDVRLQDHADGWRCLECKSGYRNPDKKAPSHDGPRSTGQRRSSWTRDF